MLATAGQLTAKPTDGPLTTEHYQELAHADERAKSIRKAVRVANFNGWTTAIIAALSAPFALFDTTNLLVTIVLSVVAFNEFRGRDRLNKFDPSATTLLGWNQLGFLLLITIYCGWMIFTGLQEADSVTKELTSSPELGELLGSSGQFGNLYELLVYAVYGSVAVLSAIFQGLTALYYFSRRKYVEAYVQSTPQWIRDLQGRHEAKLK
jgi:hypothetical protein